MLSVGFMSAVEEIYGEMNVDRQNLLFSATMPPQIRRIVEEFLHEPCFVDLVGDDNARIPEDIEMLKMPVGTRFNLPKALGAVLNQYCNGSASNTNVRALVFTKTKVECDKLALSEELKCVRAGSIHGDMSQANRERTLNAFRRGALNVLVATDVAARGIDIPGVELVVHAGIPDALEAFIHRTGRTGRAGRQGTNIVLSHPIHDAEQMLRLEEHSKRPFKQVGVPSSGSDIHSIKPHEDKSEEERLRILAGRWIEGSETLNTLDDGQRNSVVSRIAALMAFSGKFDLSCFSAITGRYGYETMRVVPTNGNESVSTPYIEELLGRRIHKNQELFPYKNDEEGVLIDLEPCEAETLRKALGSEAEAAKAAIVDSDNIEVAPYMVTSAERGRWGNRGNNREGRHGGHRGRGNRGRGNHGRGYRGGGNRGGGYREGGYREGGYREGGHRGGGYRGGGHRGGGHRGGGHRGGGYRAGRYNDEGGYRRGEHRRGRGGRDRPNRGRPFRGDSSRYGGESGFDTSY